ncbi:MAG: hypothetical protein QXV69_00145 [Sulfolobaceae archaeon]
MKKINCPKCGIVMDFLVESESNDAYTRRIRYYYRCPICGTKINDTQIQILKQNEYITIKILQ